jgi:hypothetical protein
MQLQLRPALCRRCSDGSSNYCGKRKPTEKVLLDEKEEWQMISVLRMFIEEF